MSIRTMFRIAFAVTVLATCSANAFAERDVEKQFLSPPESARPWVYWFWLNGNITKEGITADLEAMKKVGISGVLIMEVDQGAPVGPVDFMSDKWREMFKHVVSESQRLGIEVNMNNDAGWNGSGGPWVKPEESMQKVVWSEVEVAGPKSFDDALVQPKAVADFYKDIAVLAFPTPGKYRIPNIEGKAAFTVGAHGPASDQLTKEMIIEPGAIQNISLLMDANGHLKWDCPAGNWTIMRFGHTSTGAENAPAPTSGRGLECDKLSKKGSEANFNGMMKKLVEDVGPDAGKTLTVTHVDSWENGSQNWTELMRKEFKTRRGYDLFTFLPVMSGRVVESLEISERFLWDLRQTVSELVIDNYAGHIRDLAHKNGLRFTIEAYGSPCDFIPYGGRADEPMGEFWDPGGAMETCRGMASSAHVYGKRLVGAEAFTAADHERWLQTPGAIKALGDHAFCQGINRFVFHRYAMQPWVENRVPGMTMGPWGQHYERTQTWWDLTIPWHEYLTRCQYLLRQGRFVADICYLQAEAPPQGFRAEGARGYGWDECSAEVVMERMSVKDGRIVLPDGMNYKLLALSDSRAMTPELLSKIRSLVKAGATVIGPRPLKSPSLSNFPDCDERVKRISEDLWGDCDGKEIMEHRYGKGRVVWGVSPEGFLKESGIVPDFFSPEPLNVIHRRDGKEDFYFVANPMQHEMMTTASFRISGKKPELWNPETGRIDDAAIYETEGTTTRVALTLGPSESVFVVFRKKSAVADPIVSLKLNGEPIISTDGSALKKLVVNKAVYGIPGDATRTRDVRDKLQGMADRGERTFRVSRMASGDDPAYGVVKTLSVEYSLDGKDTTVSGTDPQTINLVSQSSLKAKCFSQDGKVILTTREEGLYEATTISGRTIPVTIPKSGAPLEISGPWRVVFPANSGAPAELFLEKLISWSEHSDPGVRYFSGTATYRATVDVPQELLTSKAPLYLDLGEVKEFAKVSVNAKDLGLLWKPPFRISLDGVLKPGQNELEITVTNLWPNRLIGDEQLPEDSDRNPNGTLKSWPGWLAEGKPSPTGRFTFTSWRLWRKGDALLKSGLIGPVKIEPTSSSVVR